MGMIASLAAVEHLVSANEVIFSAGCVAISTHGTQIPSTNSFARGDAGGGAENAIATNGTPWQHTVAVGGR